jgi:ABC-type uncharacterized transport system permease subunit
LEIVFIFIFYFGVVVEKFDDLSIEKGVLDVVLLEKILHEFYLIGNQLGIVEIGTVVIEGNCMCFLVTHYNFNIMF